MLRRAWGWLTGTSAAFDRRCAWVAWDTMDQVARRRAKPGRLMAADELGVGEEYRQLLTMWGERL